MITHTGRSHQFCDGVDRRSFLQVDAFGAGLTLADSLRAYASNGKKSAKKTATKSAIFVYLPGGPSHIDTFDLKPDAPNEFRGEFRPISTSVAGIQICEHLPMLAKMMDKLTILRSLTSVDEHSDSLVMTGYPERVNLTAEHPSFGSVVSKLRLQQSGAIPPNVSLRGMSRGTEPGILGITHRPFTPTGPGLANLSLVRGVNSQRLEERKSLLDHFNTARRDSDMSGSMEGMDSYTDRAIEMVTGGAVKAALDLSKEETKSRDRYKGVEQFLTARRLIEAGIGFVTLGYGGWDTHGQNFVTLKRQLPMLDRGLANMIQDLADRGRLQDTVIVVWGEFGRTPKINNTAGRDHWSPVMSALLAGGGLKVGQVIGSTTAKAERPKDRPYTVSRVLATLYRSIGIDPAQTFLSGSGRPMHILDDRENIPELI